MTGTTISHYEIQEKLGGGGMGVVYKALDTRLNRAVALKFLSPDLTHDPDARSRFVSEARAASSLDHPNICTIYEIDESEAAPGHPGSGRTFIAMAYYPGESLDRKIERGPFPLGEAVDVAAQMAQGLARAHAADIVHRDIKPANVMITAGGSHAGSQVKIVDFGLAKVSGQNRLTVSGSTLGTAVYMSPEQTRGEEVDARTDIWSLGVVLYEMIAGKPPFQGPYEQAQFYMIRHDDPRPLTGLRTGVPVSLERAVMKCLAKDPRERYQHVDELLVDLRIVARELESGGRPAAALPRRGPSRRAYLYGGGLILVAGLIALGILLERRTVSSRSAGAASTSLPSIAVLPLKSPSEDAEQAVFAEGMTEELIMTLTRIEGLTPISSRSVMRFKDSDETISEIARIAGVDYVVDGSILEADGRVRITMSLYDGSRDTPLWGGRYERAHQNVLELQQEVALAIAREIQVALTPQDRGRLARTQAVDPEAHRLFLASRSASGGPTVHIDRLKAALAIDPDYALAYGALAEAYVLSSIQGIMSPEEAFPRAKEAAARALALDPSIAEAHTALGEVSFHYEWDWAAAERHLERALESNPGYATALWRHTGHLGALGRAEESIAVGIRAQELDPPGYGGMAEVFFYSRRYEEAIEVLQTHLVTPGSPRYRGMLGVAFVLTGRQDEGIAELEQAARALEPERLDLAWGYAVTGKTDEARRILAEEERRGAYVSPYAVAAVYAGLGEVDQAIRQLEEAYRIREANLVWVNVNAAFDPLRNDPRFHALLRSMKLVGAGSG